MGETNQLGGVFDEALLKALAGRVASETVKTLMGGGLSGISTGVFLRFGRERSVSFHSF